MADISKIIMATIIYVGPVIINPPIVGGKHLIVSPDRNGDISFKFTQPAKPCNRANCEQELATLEFNLDACWRYDMIRIDNIEMAPVRFSPKQTPQAFEFLSLGDASGRTFLFRAHAEPRCTPTS
ncbi:MAG TPA: hypothetical protein VII40_15145 [Xanthobacteraceae bacterium]